MADISKMQFGTVPKRKSTTAKGTVQGLDRLFQKLDKLRRHSERKNNGSVVVGYSAAYAIFVHENLEARHGYRYNAAHRTTVSENPRGPDQTAKFLEKPARRMFAGGMRGTFAKEVLKQTNAGINLTKALLVVGLRLQRESQKIVPVDTGNLKNSAYTELE